MICRLCLENLNVDSAIRLFDCSQGFGHADIVAMITKYFQLELTPEDNISTRICQVCFDHLEDFNRFWRHVDKKQQTLQEQYKAEFLEVKCDEMCVEHVELSTLPLESGDSLEKAVCGDALLPVKFEDEDDVEDVIDAAVNDDTAADVPCKIESDSNVSSDDSTNYSCDEDSFSSDDDIPLKSFEKVPKSETNSTESRREKAKKSHASHKNAETKRRRTSPASNVELDCQLCDEKIKSFEELVNHFAAMHADKTPFLKCCEKTLADKGKYIRHMKWHRNADKSKCTYCGKILSSARSMKFHVQAKHERKDNETQSLNCIPCEKSFASKKYYENHLKWHENQGQFICETCGKSYTKEVHLKRHVQAIHSHVYPYKCVACNEFFNFKEELDAHDAVCEVKPLLLNSDGQGAKPNEACVCKICMKIFAIPKYLRRHMKAVHADTAPLVCDQCGKHFKCQPTFDKHVLEHAGVVVDQPVQCEKCGKWCKNKTSHKFHLSRHDEILNKCHLCGRECPSRRALKGHMEAVHRNEKNFKCQICEKSFKNALILKEHMAKHTGTKLYSCPHCPKETRSKANMYTHIKKNHVQEWIKSKMARSYDPNINTSLS